MPQVRPIITDFTGGEVSPRLYGRVDTAKYKSGCSTIENFVVLPFGGVRRRMGSIYKGRVKTHSEKARLVRFQYSTSQAYVIQFSPSYMRFYTPSGGVVISNSNSVSGITKANPGVVTYTGADNYANGDRVIITGVVGMTEVNGVEYTVANVNTGANTFELSGVNTTTYTTYSSGGTINKILEVAHTYTESELPNLSFAQSNDTLYIAHNAHPLAQLVRSSAVVWTLSNTSVLKGPWRSLNKDNTISIKSNDWTGSVALTASSTLFDSTMVGAIFKVFTPDSAGVNTEWASISDTTSVGEIWDYNGNSYEIISTTGAVTTQQLQPPIHQSGTATLFKAGRTTEYDTVKFLHKGYGIVTLSSFTSSTLMNGTVYTGYGYNELPRALVDPALSGGAAANARYTGATTFWQEGAWSAYRGYPSKITFFQQRLMAAATTSQTQTLWGSVTGDFINFEEGSDDAQALNYTLSSEESDAIRWLVPAKQLIIGTASGEYVMSSSSQNEAVTPKNVKISRETKYGSSLANPVRVAASTIYVQRRGDLANAGRKIREMAYDFNTDSFQSAELSIWSEHITGTGVIALEYQSDPDGLIWAVREDGRMAACTFQKEQQVVAWHKHFLGGYSDAGHTAVPVIESICTVPGVNRDEVWMVVKRYINGQTVRYIEALAHYDDNTAQADCVFLDCSITYSGSSATAITGLQHLAGETVSILSNGAKVPDQVVSATGTLTLPSATTKAIFGYKYKSTLETLDLEAGAAQGTAQGVAKRATKLMLRLDRSLGGRYGIDSTVMDDLTYRTPESAMGSAVDLYTGDIILDAPSKWDRKLKIRIENEDPFPMCIIAIALNMTSTG